MQNQASKKTPDMPPEIPDDIQQMSFEKALAELEEIVRKLESGESPLEESIQAYERGVALKRHCESKLKDAQMKIEKITTQGDTPQTEAFDPQTA